MSNNASFKIDINFKNIKSLEQMISKLDDFIKKTSDFTPFFEQTIIPDIYKQNSQIFTNKGYNEYGDGNQWADNQPGYANWKKGNAGKTVDNLFGNYPKTLTISNNPDIGVLTGKMKKALTNQGGLKQDIYNSGSTLKVSVPNDISYMQDFKEGTMFSPPRNIFFIGSNQREHWKQKLSEYLGVGALVS
jgi:hypothetical protein